MVIDKNIKGNLDKILWERKIMENNTRIFRKTQRKRPPTHHPLLAFDIENNSDTGAFICAAVYGEIRIKAKINGKVTYKNVKIETWKGTKFYNKTYFTSQTEFTEALMSLRPEGMKEIPTKLIAFNLSYDLWFIMKISEDNETLSNGSNIIISKLKNGLKIQDLTNLTRQGSLEAWIGYLKDEMSKYGITKKESLDNLEIRVKSDAKATWVLGNYLENFFTKEIGIPLKLTIAGAARYLFSLKYFNDYWIREEKSFWKSEYERKAYRGGRVEAFKGGKERVFVGYDVNSMYLSIMRDEVFPDPNTAKFHDSPLSLPPSPTLYIADVTLTIPKQYIGPLPVLSPETGKLIFPTGTFRAHFASPELNYAIKECSVKVIKIHSYMTYEAKPYFKNYANFIWKKRKKYKDKGNKGMDILIKYLGNVLYGGFGQKNKDSFFGKLEDLDVDSISGRPKISEIKGVKYVTVTATDGEDSQHTFPCIPVFITSFARLFLLKALKANAENLIYTDTDSLKLRNVAKGIDVGDDLGEWGYEGVNIDVSVYKSKMYGDKCKGVPKSATLEWEDSVRKIYSYRKPNKMRESFRRGLTPALWKKVIKEVSKIDDKRIWITEKVSEPPFLEAT
jgi:hypothetical protein